MSEPLMSFPNKAAAQDWMDEQVDDPCVDNDRFAFADDAAAMAEYHERADDGCCGSFDAKVLVGGRLAWIGCNYGH